MGNFYPRTELAAWRIETNTGNPRSVVFLERLVALILLMRAYPEVALPVIQGIPVDVINLIA